MEVPGPQEGHARVPVADFPDGVVQGACGQIGVECAYRRTQALVETGCHLRGGGVVNLPEGADDMPRADKEERRGEMDRLIEQIRVRGVSRAAGRQEDEPQPVMLDTLEAAHGERRGLMVVEVEQAL